MNENTLVSTTELQKRYGITKATVYSRLKALSVKPIRKGHKSYLTAEQLQLADDLNAYMKSSGTMEEFVQQCQASGRIVVPKKTATETAIVPTQKMTAFQTQESTATTISETAINPETTRQNEIENLQAQKGKQTRQKDIKKVNKRARKRAFDQALAEETLVLFYETTEQFTPEEKEQLEQHRAACELAKEKGMEAYDVNDFLALAIEMTGIKF